MADANTLESTKVPLPDFISERLRKVAAARGLAEEAVLVEAVETWEREGKPKATKLEPHTTLEQFDRDLNESKDLSDQDKALTRALAWYLERPWRCGVASF
jgi:dienelactone hydrolase